MKKINRIICTIYILGLSLAGMAQIPSQTIRGTIVDEDTRLPLIGVTVLLLDQKLTKGAITDVDGRFRLSDIPVGRISLKVSYIGYEERVIPNILVGSAKEVILNVNMTESLDQLEEVVIKAQTDKSEVLNEMSVVSARTFSVEETQRYAGTFNDPARMAASFAGVSNDAQGNNDIIVRGNSPQGILWRMEGIEIPNPNHFGSEGASGGPISALNSNVLSNSDFLTGAFSPEYGNATSGVFDIQLKKGNNEQREYTFGLSTMGIELAAEGPIMHQKGSYLVNYRYSTLELLDRSGIVNFGGVPRYQDLAFKVWMPIGTKHQVSTFGLLGSNGIDSETTAPDNDERIVSKDEFDGKLGTIGLSHLFFINDRAFLKNTIAFTGTETSGFWKIPDENENFRDVYNARYLKSRIIYSSMYNLKVSARSKLETGLIHNMLNYNMRADEFNFDTDVLERILSDKGSSAYSQAYGSWKYRATRRLTFISGLHYLHFHLNDNYSIEPRAALKWKFRPGQSLTLGYGRHSKLQALSTYLVRAENPEGNLEQQNRDLEISKADHFVLGYDRMLGDNTRLKVEAYYQNLFDVPIEDADTSTFSILNVSEEFPRRKLVNEGTGRNYGLEFTLERYLNRGFYYMSTLSLYQSLYTPKDGIERKTTYNGNYNFNLLGGKEFKVGRASKNKIFFINTKVAFMGPRWRSKIDMQESSRLGFVVRDESDPYSVRGDDIFKADLSFGIRRNKAKTRTEWKFDIQNVTNNQALVYEYYEPVTETVEAGNQLPLLPTISYKVEF